MYNTSYSVIINNQWNSITPLYCLSINALFCISYLLMHYSNRLQSIATNRGKQQKDVHNDQ